LVSSGASLSEELANLSLSSIESWAKSLYKGKETLVLPEAEKLYKFRQLIGGALSAPRIVLEAGLADFIQDDFVAERRSSQECKEEAVTSDDLITWMALAKYILCFSFNLQCSICWFRVIALSMHKLEVSKDIWEKAKTMEKRRRRRVAAYRA
jgi:hypothetical protein